MLAFLALLCCGGEEIWKVALGAGGYAAPAVDGEQVYFAHRRGLAALRWEDGKEVWKADGNQPGRPAFDPKLGLAFAGQSDGFLRADDRKNGEPMACWRS